MGFLVDIKSGRMTSKESLWEAAGEGNLESVRELAGDPSVNVNWIGPVKGDSPIHQASRFARLEVLRELLGNPRVDVTQRNHLGGTPLSISCFTGNVEMTLLLLGDPRFDPNLITGDGSTPLWFASQNGHLPIVAHLFALEVVINTSVVSTWNSTTAAEHARNMAGALRQDYETEDDPPRRKRYNLEVADLINDYERDPAAVRRRMRRNPRIRDTYIARVFAIVIFFTDGFVGLKPAAAAAAAAATATATATGSACAKDDPRRFLRITSGLPMDLQMLLCNRMFGSPRDIVLPRDSEPGFRWLANPHTWAPH